MAENKLTELISNYRELCDRRAAIEAELKEVKSMQADSEYALSEYMAEIGTEKVTVNGYSYGLVENLEVSKIAGEEERLFDQLREDGLGDLIHLDVNASRLKAALRVLASENDGELPSGYNDCVRQYRHYTISRRKA